MKGKLFQKLPKVDKLLNCKELEVLGKEMDYFTFSESIKSGINFFREQISRDEIKNFTDTEIIEKIIDIANKDKKNSLKALINGTGTIIHTNLGRSLFTEKMIKNIEEISLNYSNLEYNLETGSRGSRYVHLEELICKVTGGESAIVVNNNASAVILCLNEFGKGKETIVSRGELVEIGGSFRIPEIMELSGTKLREVGTTNRTNLQDYNNAITEETALLLKVHSSNYKMSGFVKTVEIEDLSKLGNEKKITTMEDIGSGVLVDFSKYGLTKEKTVQESLKAGVDIITFSGDKLLGGPQAGIIVGKKELIERISKNQYLRAFRMDKNSIAALEVVFRYYLDEREAIKEIPTLKMILENPKKVENRAQELSNILNEKKIINHIISTRAKIGGGSMPEETVSSYGIKLEGNANLLEQKFRKNDIPVIGRIYEDSYIIDMKTVREKEIPELASIIAKLCQKLEN